MDKKLSKEDFFSKIELLKKNSGADLLTHEDLSLAAMNLISLEEHFFFTAMKTGKDEYFDSSLKIREIRKEVLARLMPNNHGETWCAAKHLLSASMRLIEVGNKLYSENKKEEAKKMFEDAYKLYSIFWALKLSLVSVSEIKSAAKESSNLEDLVSRLANCCEE